MLGTLRTSAAAWAAVCVVFVRWHVFFLISYVKEAVWRAFRCVRRGLWSCTRVWHWLYDGLSSEEKSARRARVRVMALLVVSATVWFGVYASLRVGLADEQASIGTDLEHWSSPEDPDAGSTSSIGIPKARHQTTLSHTRRPRVGDVGPGVYIFVRPGTSAYATGRTFHYQFLPNCHHRRSMVQAWQEKSLSRRATSQNRGWMMEGYRCVFGGSGADYSSSGTPDVVSGTPKLNAASEANAGGEQESACGESAVSSTPAIARRKKTYADKQLRKPTVNHKKGKSHATKKQRVDVRTNTGTLGRASVLTTVAISAMGCLYAIPASAAPTNDCAGWTKQSQWWGSVLAGVGAVVLMWGGAYCSKSKDSTGMPTVTDVPPPDASNGALDGLSIRLLKQILAQLPAGRDWTTAQVCKMYVKEVTKESKQSFTEDYRRKNQGTTDVGLPDVFVSHAWSNSFRDLVEGVAMQSKKLGFDESTRVYVCMLCNNQHEWDGSNQVDFATLAKQFKSNLVSTGIVIAIFDPWDKPTYLTRSWCIYELLQAILLGDQCKYYVVIPPSQRDSFIEALCGKFDKIMEVISAVKVEDADASVQSDREGVLHEIRASEGGVASCNQVVCEGVRNQVRVIAEEVLAEMDAEGVEDEAMWSLCNGLARLYEQQGMLEQAGELKDRAVELAEKLFGPESTKMATSLNNKAALLSDMGKLEEAAPLYKRAVAVWEKALGPDHPQVATGLNNQALLLQAMGKHDEALPLYKRSRDIKEKVFGPDHPKVALALNNEAALLSDMGKHEEALPLYQRSRAIDEKVYGPDHPEVATDLNNEAELLRQMGKPEEALPLYKRSREIFEKVLGQDHPNVATLLNNEAGLLSDMGKYEEASPLYKRSRAIREKVYGPDHPSVAESLNNEALLLKKMGKIDEALVLFERSITIKEKALGPDHMSVINTRGNLGMAQMESSDPQTVKAGRDVVRTVLRALRDTHSLPESHPWIKKFSAALD